jgi:hypothetical protein
MKTISQSSREQLRGAAKILQAVTATLVFGAIIGLIVVVGFIPDPLNNDPNMLVILGAFTGMVSFGLSYVVAAIFNSDHSSNSAQNHNNNSTNLNPEDSANPLVDADTEKQIQRASSQVMNSHIVRSAIIEGAVFLNLMVLLLERNYISVAVILLGVLLLLVLMPTHHKMIKSVQTRLK